MWKTLPLLAALLAVAACAPPLAATPAATQTSSLQRNAESSQAKLRRTPQDASTWAQLGSTHAERARVTFDPQHHARAEKARTESLRLKPDGNGEAFIGVVERRVLIAFVGDRHRRRPDRRLCGQTRVVRLHLGRVVVEVIAEIRVDEAVVVADLWPGVTVGRHDDIAFGRACRGGLRHIGDRHGVFDSSGSERGEMRSQDPVLRYIGAAFSRGAARTV